MRAAGGIKPGPVHNPAFMAESSAMFARVPNADGTAYASLLSHAFAGTTCLWRSAVRPPHAFFFSSLMLENVMPSARSLT